MKIESKNQGRLFRFSMVLAVLCFGLLAFPPLAAGNNQALDGLKGNRIEFTVVPPVVATFDFDSGLPVLPAGKNTPLDQSVGGVSAHFSSPSDPGTFSVQSQSTTFYNLSQFSGQYLLHNNIFKDKLEIRFSQTLTNISLTFATSDSHSVGSIDTPSFIKLTAFMNSTSSTSIGSTTAQGVFTTDVFPQGTLTFDSGTADFNIVIIELPPQTNPVNSFLIDNVTITTASIASGDANLDGQINMADVTKVEREILGLDLSTASSDANSDGIITMGDVTKIERIILGLP